MDNYEPDTYGERIADVYDAVFSGDPDNGMIDLLTSLAGAGPVLELAVGTGRVAIPLADRGLEVHGVDTSPAMLQQLRTKPGGDKVALTTGDMAGTQPEGPFSCVFVVFNSLFTLPTQEDQLRCFASAAARLKPGGCFVMECFVPDPTRFDRNQRVSANRVELNDVMFSIEHHRPAAQMTESQHVMITETGVRLFPVTIRYAWPSELDLMARLAGLRLRDRWANWERQPFGDDSTHHISVYERPHAD